jgi:hypothetical protein
VDPHEPSVIWVNRAFVSGTALGTYSVFSHRQELAGTLVHEGWHTVQYGRMTLAQRIHAVANDFARLETEAYQYEDADWRPDAPGCR